MELHFTLQYYYNQVVHHRIKDIKPQGCNENDESKLYEILI